LRQKSAVSVCWGRRKDGQGPICLVAPYGDICPLGDFLTPKCELNVQNQRITRLKLVYNM